MKVTLQSLSVSAAVSGSDVAPFMRHVHVLNNCDSVEQPLKAGINAERLARLIRSACVGSDGTFYQVKASAMSLMELIHDALLYPRETKCDLQMLCSDEIALSYNAIPSTAPAPVQWCHNGGNTELTQRISTTQAALATIT